jgi:hypothetical protein
MAEFKLGRIRFVWKNTWSASTTYYRDDVVTNGGRMYICTIGHTSQSDFFSDFDIDPPKWNLVADGFNWKGDWATGTEYIVNDIVKYGANLYIATENHTSAATAADGLEVDIAKWNQFGSGLDWKGDWSDTTRYKVDDMVKYGGVTYVCNTAHTSQTYLTDDQAKWDEFNKGIDYKTEWGSGNLYKVNDVIKFGANLYICIAQHTASADFATDSANWEDFVEGFEFNNDWDTYVQYKKGDIVRYGGYQYVALTTHTGTNPASVNNDWEVFAKGFNFRGDWGDDSSGQDYRVGDVVRVNGYTYVAVADNNGSEPPSANWERLNSGFHWRGLWIDDAEYKVGDVVRYGSNSYVCILGHISEGDDFSTATPTDPGGGNQDSRPDLDVTGTYWNIMTIGSELDVLTVKGDLVYYSGAGPARLPIGREGQILRVNGNSEPEWAFLGQNPDVYYVATQGRDVPAPERGTTLDAPWASVRYAAQQIEHGVKYPMARKLLELNRQFIQRETVEWTDYQVTNNVSPFTTAFTYNGTKCERDVGYIIEAVVYDLTHGGNAKSREAAIEYVTNAGQFYTLGQEEETVASLNYSLGVMGSVLAQTDPDTNYQTTNGDNSTAVVAQYKDATLDAESGALARVTELVGIITDAITAGNSNNIPSKIDTTTLIRVATGTYKEVLPIQVPAFCCVMGDELRSTTVEPRVAGDAGMTPRSDTKYSFAALERMEAIVGDIVTGASVTPTTGNTETQVAEWPYGEADEGEAAKQLARSIRKRIDWHIGDKLEGNLTPAYDLADPNYGYSRDNILLNKEFIKAEITAYIDDTYDSLLYSRTKCKQDVGYIVDAVAYDLTYGGNWMTQTAGLAYFSGTNGTLQIDSSEKTATLAVYAYLKSILQPIGRNIAVTPVYQSALTQITGPNAGSAAASTTIGTLIDDMIDIVNLGPSAASITYPSTSGADADEAGMFDVIDDNRISIQTGAIDFISKNFGSFKYDSAKCRRDLRLIMGDVGYGAVFGSNFNAIQTGLAYNRGSNAYNLTNQKTETIGALRYAKTLVNETVTTDGSSATGSSTYATRTDAAFDELVDIIRNGTAAADAITYPDPVGVVTNRKNAKDQLVANRQFLIDEVVGWIDAQVAIGTGIWAGYSYDSTKCARDVGYIVDGLAYDILYQGTLATTRIAQSYFDGNTSQLYGGEAQTAAAYNHLASIIEDVVQENTVTPTYSATSQDTGGTAATGTEATELSNKLQIIEDVITAGNLNSLPAIVYPDISGETAEYVNARSNLVSDAEDIIPQVIQYINTTYNDFNYDQAKCQRDIGMLLDAARYDGLLDTNYGSIVYAYSYLREPSAKVTGNQKDATLAANEYVRQQIVDIINATAYGSGTKTAVTNAINSTWKWVDDIIFSGSSEAANQSTALPNPHAAARLLELNKDFIKAEIHAYVSDYFSANVTRGTNSDNTLTTADTSWLSVGMPVVFSNPDDSSNAVSQYGTDFAGPYVGLEADTTYYVREIVSATEFTISETQYGSEFTIQDTEATIIVSKAYEYNMALCSRDVDAYVDALKWDITYPKDYARSYTDGITVHYPGMYKTKMAARLYANSVLGSQEEDFFYLRNATGLRLMTMRGLNGDLTPVNEYGTSRVTAGAYGSLDPGWGPDDQSVWIATRSPYIQNCTTFGNAAVGQKIDGALHNGGNDSIVSNDFTQVISDGIGAWLTNNGRAEMVSVFTYYSHIGYLCESGGRARATNGNNSYGTWGSVAEGVDQTETPITAIVDNKKQFNATISNVEVDGDKLIALEFDHAGNEYTEALINIFGSGTGAETEADEVRDDGVNRIRIIETDDSSGALGGSGYKVAENTAQTGSSTSVTLAATDGEPDSAYPGMKVFITGGAGVGQYATIDTYSSGSKEATVLKDDGVTSGWEHLNPGTTIVSPNSSSTYRIEPSVTFTAPPYSSAAQEMSAAAVKSSAAYCETAAIYTGLTGSSLTLFGNGASFEVTRNTSKYIVAIEDGGTNYVRGDEIVIPGNQLGGATPANDLTITVTSINSTTGAVTAFDISGVGLSGKYVATQTGTTTLHVSDGGGTWSTVSMGGSAPSGELAIVNGVISDGSSDFRTSVTVVVGESISADQVWYSEDLASWTNTSLPLGPYSGTPSVAFGQGKFVVIFSGSLDVFESNNGGVTWARRSGALPATGFNKLTYGAGRFVAVRSGTTDSAYCDIIDTSVWTGTTLPTTSDWVGLAHGNNRFLTVSSSDNKAAYSLDRGETWITADLPDYLGGVNAYTDVQYGQGVFMATANNANPFNEVYTSENGVDWTTRTTAADADGTNTGFIATAFGNPNNIGYWIAFAGSAETHAVRIQTGARARGRVGVANEQVFEVRLLEPGSGYTSGAPTMTITDPNNIFDVQFTVRTGKGSLANPTFISRGTGYQAASSEIAASESNGFAEFFQTGTFIAVRQLTERPVPGANIVFDSLPDQVFKLVNTVTFLGDEPGSYTTFLNISPEMTVLDAPDDGDPVTMRIRYSQVRLTGHDFLDIGTGGFTSTNYPNQPLIDPDQTKETRERDGGRVFYTATDQDGNFRVGGLFSVEQATGVATLNADAFNIAGLQELSLGEVTLGGNSASITEFSTDPFFTANSDTVVPTQRAVKAYIEAQIGGGGASLNVNTVTAGSIFIGTNIITTVDSSAINIKATTEFTGGVTGIPVAINYFLR